MRSEEGDLFLFDREEFAEVLERLEEEDVREEETF